MNFPGQEPRPRPVTEPHIFVMGKYPTQCARCFLREHNPIHVPPPEPEPLPDGKNVWDPASLMPGYKERGQQC